MLKLYGFFKHLRLHIFKNNIQIEHNDKHLNF